MIQGILFSKDRALQLDGTLASFFRCVPDAGAVDLTVLHCASDSRFAAQYEEVKRVYAPRVRFVAEVDFRRQVLDLVGGNSRSAAVSGAPPVVPSGTAGQKEDESGVDANLILFLVDDCLFVREMHFQPAVLTLRAHPDAIGLSLRLGHNTVRSYVQRRKQLIPDFVPAGPDLFKYRWPEADGDFGYPLELSSSLYRATLMTMLLKRIRFRDPNTLESQLALQAPQLARELPWLICPETSVAFSAPANRVQAVFANRAGSRAEYSIQALADRFDQGERLNLDGLLGLVPSACHQEVELHFARRDG